MNCINQLSPVQLEGVTHLEAIPSDLHERNPQIVCRMFESRQMFMTNCQFNHYQFDQV